MKYGVGERSYVRTFLYTKTVYLSIDYVYNKGKI